MCGAFALLEVCRPYILLAHRLLVRSILQSETLVETLVDHESYLAELMAIDMSNCGQVHHRDIEVHHGP